jgi:hypothetical protein
MGLQQEFQAKLAQPDYYSQYWQLQQNPKAAADFPNEVKGLKEYGNISSNLGVKISSNCATSLASILGNQNFFRPSFSSDRTAAQSQA